MHANQPTGIGSTEHRPLTDGGQEPRGEDAHDDRTVVIKCDIQPADQHLAVYARGESGHRIEIDDADYSVDDGAVTIRNLRRYENALRDDHGDGLLLYEVTRPRSTEDRA